MVIFVSLPVPLSLAETLRMPFASMSNVTSICGRPRGAGGMPSRWKRPRVRLSRAISRSPCRTWISTEVWESEAVEKTSERFAGMVVFRSMSLVITPPSVSTPRDSGVTSRRRMSFTSPERTPACTAAPTATTSSGFTVRFGSLPKNFFTVSMIFGMRVWPPTSTISSICDGWSFASARHLRVGSMERSTRSSTSASSFARESLMERCFGPVWSAVRNGRLISVSAIEESSIFAFSAASLRRWSTILSFETSMPVSLLELGDEPVDDPLVDVVAAEVGVAVRGEHLDDVLPHLEDRDVEGAAAEVVDRDLLVLLLVEAVGEGRRRRLVHDAPDVQARDLAGVLRRLPLGVVEVRGHGDDRVRHLLAEVVLGGPLQLEQHLRADLRGRVLLPVDLEAGVAVRPLHDVVRDALHLVLHLAEAAPHEPLDGVDGLLGVRDRLALRHLADEPLPLLRIGDDARGEPRALLVGDDDGVLAFHHRHHGVRGAEVDADDLGHVVEVLPGRGGT